MSITADQIRKLLAVKHADDVFVPECKSGPTQGAAHIRLDGWAMAKSWANPKMWGYEIKVSRSDFLNDRKWHNYLPLCNELSFVCPTDLIQPSELTDGVGLIWVSTTGTRLYTKRKAAHRQIPFPEDLVRYVLMCRARTSDHEIGNAQNNRDYWNAWLEMRDKDRDLGYRVSRKVSELASKARFELYSIEQREKNVKLITDRLEQRGLNLSHTWDLDQKIDEVLSVVPDGFKGSLDGARSSIARLQTALHQLEQKHLKLRNVSVVEP